MEGAAADEDPRWFGVGGGFSSPSDAARNLKNKQLAPMVRKRQVARTTAALEDHASGESSLTILTCTVHELAFFLCSLFGIS
eukprot:1059583-Amphidinium_carterae.1